MKNILYRLDIILDFLIATICTYTNVAESQQKNTIDKKVTILQEKVTKLIEKQRDLEARIAVLERLNLTPSPDLLRASWLSASKDEIIRQIVNIAANAYQYRLRPATMGGGGGTYEGYKIPKMMMTSDYAKVEMTTSKDSIILMGVSTKGLGTVQATLKEWGRTENWIYTGEFE